MRNDIDRGVADGDASVHNKARIALTETYSQPRERSKQTKRQTIGRRAHIYYGIVALGDHKFQDFPQIAQRRMAHFGSEGDNAVDRGMPRKEVGELRIEHKMDFGIGETPTYGIEQSRSKHGVAHLAETDNEELHSFKPPPAERLRRGAAQSGRQSYQHLRMINNCGR